MLANYEIRTKAKEREVFLWELANAMKISEPTMTRKMRTELPAEEKQNILALIDEIAKQKTA